MEIRTSSGNIYSYNRQTGEILAGRLNIQLPHWDFAPIKFYSSLPKVDSFILGLTEHCNLRCTYCCYSGDYPNKRTHSFTTMTQNDIDAIFDFIVGFTDNRPITIFIYGGEPLLKYPLLRYAVERGQELLGENVRFVVSTNGTTLSNDRIDWLILNNITIAISIDGTEQYHNHYRIDINGNGSYGKLYDALSYIKASHPEYLRNLSLIMTLASFDKIAEIAEAWHNDSVLHDLEPTMLNSLAPNFNNGVDKAKYEEVKGFYEKLLNIYESHQDWLVLRKLLDSCIAYWKERPIFSPSKAVPMATCLPDNTKLYIDPNLKIGICEKMPDIYRIGSVKDGIDWNISNEIIQSYYNQRLNRCKDCSAVRMCNMCLSAMEYTQEQWDVLCHNEKVYMKVFMWLFCEMAERGLIK